MPQGIPPHGSQHLTSQDLTGLARAALAGSGGDRDGFVRACWQYARDAARTFGRKQHGAEDSAQDAAIVMDRLLKRKPPELDPESVGAFLRIVVLRDVHEVARRRVLEAKAAREASPSRREAPDTAREVETEEWARRVRDVIDTLPHLLRRIVCRRYWDDLSVRDIARELGTSHTSIVRLLGEAEDTLRAALRGPDGIDDERGDTTFADDECRP